jgi:hypothetical protein
MSILAALNSVHFWHRADDKFSAATVADTHCAIVLEGIVQRDALRAYHSLPR